MQIRRPLCLFSLIFVLLMMGFVYGGKWPDADEITPQDGGQTVLSGVVINKEYRVMYGEKVPVLYVSDVRDKNDRQVMCYLKDAGEETALPRIGETVRVSGKVSLFREASNPGEFNLKEYYQILRISYKLNQTEILERSESCFPFKEKLFRIKSGCCEVLEKIYPEKEASILKAMLLGEKNGLEEEIKELYQLNGLIHILAISGLHVSLIGTAVSGLFKKCGMPLWLRAPIAIGVMWCYGVMTGMGVSTWRAVFMFSMHLAAGLLGRTYDMLTALSLAAFLMLAEQPLLVKHSGFLLSFGAVLGIGLVLPWWREVLQGLWSGGRGEGEEREEGEGDTKPGERERTRAEKREGRVRKLTAAGGKKIVPKQAAQSAVSKGTLWNKLTCMVIDGFCLSCATAITTLPILFTFYYKYSLYSLFLNLYVIPLMGVVFAVGMGSMAAGFLLRAAGMLAGIPDRFILWLYEASCREALKLPGAVVIGGRPEVWQTAIYYGILFSLILWHNLEEEGVVSGWGARRKRGHRAGNRGRRLSCPGGEHRGKALIQCFAVAGIVWLLLLRPTGGFSVSFLDVGQGDCTVIRNENGACYMVDGGSTSKSQVGKYSILPYLESEGIGALEAVFLTHPDEDHISGVMELMEQSAYGVRINSLILPDASPEIKEEKLAELRKQAAGYGIPVYYIGRGDTVQDKDLKISCLGPERGIQTDEVNEISIVLYVEYGEFQMLLTGDVTGEPEKELLAEVAEKKPVTVLKVAHHGSKYSTPQELLDLTKPVYAIISAGKNNRYGHPHGELMERLKGRGCHIYQTMESGAVTMKVRDGRIRVEEFLR